MELSCSETGLKNNAGLFQASAVMNGHEPERQFPQPAVGAGFLPAADRRPKFWAWRILAGCHPRAWKAAFRIDSPENAPRVFFAVSFASVMAIFPSVC
jgi:hypothetical protein